MSIIVVRALEFLKREEATHVETLKIDNYETLSNAIAKSEEKTNPYKQEMLSLANNLQFLTVKYQTDIMTLRLDIEYFYEKITYYDITEFLSSFFYSFLFCIFVLTSDCFCGSTKYCIDMVSLISIISFLYWIFIWIYYCISIKDRAVNGNGIAHEFTLKKSVLYFLIFTLTTSGISLLFHLSSLLMTIIYISIIVISALFLIIKFVRKKRMYSIFTHYFNLIHLGIVIFSIGIFCGTQYLFLDTEFVFDASFAKISSISFALLSSLIFPLAIPLFRFTKEVNRAVKKCRILTIEFTEENQKKKLELEDYFSTLFKLRSLSTVVAVPAKKETEDKILPKTTTE